MLLFNLRRYIAKDNIARKPKEIETKQKLSQFQ